MKIFKHGGFMRRLLLFFSLFLSLSAFAADTVEVWKDPNCGCCGAWVDHMKAAGFEVKVNNVADLHAARRKNGVPQALGACHTARVGGYAVEGHVPAADIKRLLREKPMGVAGIAVPGMPAGSPGMEAPSTQPYASVAFSANGATRVWQTHAPNDHLKGKPQ